MLEGANSQNNKALAATMKNPFPISSSPPHEEESLKIEHGSGSVFADLGLPDASEMSLKSSLAVRVVRAVRERGLSQRAAAELVGLKQPDLSNIMNARLDGISVERLFTVLNRLGHRIEVRVEEEESEDARTLVLA